MANFNIPSRLFNFNDVPPSDGLISAWNLATVNDSFGTNNLTNNNGVTFVAGKIGNCASFDGISKYLSIVDNALLSFGAGKKASFCGWFKLTAYPGAGVRSCIIGKSSVGGASVEYIIDVTEDGTFRFIVSPDGVSLNILSSPAGIVQLNVWYFFCCWYDGNSLYSELNNNGTIYKLTYTSDIFNGTSDFCIGARNSTTSFLTGFIDAVRVYKHNNRVLTAAERTVLYNLGLGREFVSSNIISSGEINSDLNQLINIFNGITTDVTPKISVDLVDATLTINQQGSGSILQCYNNSVLKVEVNNSGQFVSKLATGTAPIIISSALTTKVDNLNVDLLDGLNASDFLQINQFLYFCDSVNYIDALVAVDKITGISGDLLIGAKIYCRTLPSSDAIIQFGIYNQAGTLLGTLTLNNTLNLNQYSVTPIPINGYVTVKVLFAVGTTMPNDVTVALISRKTYI